MVVDKRRGYAIISLIKTFARKENQPELDSVIPEQ